MIRVVLSVVVTAAILISAISALESMKVPSLQIQDGSNAPSLEPIWSHEGEGAHTYDVPGEDMVLIGSDDSLEAVVFSTGETIWSITRDERLNHPIVAGDTIYVITGFHGKQRRLIAFDLASGEYLWSRDVDGDKAPSRTTASSNMAFIGETEIVQGSPRFHLTAIDSRSGEQVWRTPWPSVPTHILFDESSETVIATTENNETIYRINTQNGRKLWRYKGEPTESDIWIEIKDTKLFVKHLQNRREGDSLVILSKESGEVLEKFAPGSGGWVLADDGSYSVHDWMKGDIHFYNPEGDHVWSENEGKKDHSIESSFGAAGPPIFGKEMAVYSVNSENRHRVKAVDLQRGRQAWLLGTTGYTHDPIIDGGKVYIASLDKDRVTSVQAVDLKTGAIIWKSRFDLDLGESEPTAYFGGIMSPMALSNGRLFLGMAGVPTSVLFEVDPDSGDLMGRAELGESVSPYGRGIEGKVIFEGRYNIYAFKP